MHLLKQKTKDIVSGANVAMPASFVKPLEYSVDLLVRTHPTLREYNRQTDLTEVDPAYHLYPSKRERIEVKDEIALMNIKKDSEKDFVKSLSKSYAGSFINQVAVPT